MQCETILVGKNLWVAGQILMNDVLLKVPGDRKYEFGNNGTFFDGASIARPADKESMH